MSSTIYNGQCLVVYLFYFLYIDYVYHSDVIGRDKTQDSPAVEVLVSGLGQRKARSLC